jgi:hypothetical protein
LVFPTDGWKIKNHIFYFPDHTSWYPDKPAYKDIQKIIASIDTSDFDFITDTVASIIPDSVQMLADTLRGPMPIDSVYTYTYPFEYPEGQDTLLYPFFRTINILNKKDKPVRILHYGDSQIEGDRITSAIRNYMQKKFGGRGCGLIPVVPVTDAARTFQQDIPEKWVRLSLLDRKGDSLVQHRKFGIAGALSRYMPADSTDTITHIGLKPIYFGYKNARYFTHVKLFYGTSANMLSVIVNKTDTQQLNTQPLISSFEWKSGKRQTSFHISMHSRSFPDIYGIALDGDKGIAVDNIPLRGSTGSDFTRMNKEQFHQMFQMMDVEMVILQFGANAVMNITDNYDYYYKSMTRQLKMMKSLKPELAIVIIGVGDMSQNTAKGYKSYPHLNKVRDAQRKAALDNGCIFWDLYEAMGGEDSMPSWVLADPPLAQKDFVHFTYTGARIVGELFCRAWTKDYLAYMKDVHH